MQLLELQGSRDLLITENQQLKGSLGRAIAITSEFEESLRDKEAALHDPIANQSEDLKNEDEAKNSYEGTSCYVLLKSFHCLNSLTSWPASGIYHLLR